LRREIGHFADCRRCLAGARNGKAWHSSKPADQLRVGMSLTRDRDGTMSLIAGASHDTGGVERACNHSSGAFAATTSTATLRREREDFVIADYKGAGREFGCDLRSVERTTLRNCRLQPGLQRDRDGIRFGPTTRR
jgi:hypothetical protein